MATYAESRHRQELAARRQAQDRRDAAQHRAFDLAAQDRHHKFERAHFAVVGEGTATAQAAYRAGWVRIFGGAHGC